MSATNNPKGKTVIQLSLSRLTSLAIIIIVVGIFLLYGLKGIGTILLVLGAVSLFIAAKEFLLINYRGQRLMRWVIQLDPILKWSTLGVLLVIIGLLSRVGPTDISILLIVIGIGLLFGSSAFLIPRFSRERPNVSSDSANTKQTNVDSIEIDQHTQLTEGFRRKIAESLFRELQRSSHMTFVVGLTFFGFGILTFGLLGYSAYQLFVINPNQQSTLLGAVSRYFSNLLDGSSSEAYFLVLMLVVSLFALIGWVANKFINQAKEVIYRQYFKETLEQLGPLEMTLAGIPPKKPILHVVEQSLEQTQKSFVIRNRISMTLLVIGTILIITLIVYSYMYGFKDWVLTATIGGAGIISFIFSMVNNRQSEVMETLQEVVKIELKVAHAAQRAEIADLVAAHFLRTGISINDTEKVKALLESLLYSQEFTNDDINIHDGQQSQTLA